MLPSASDSFRFEQAPVFAFQLSLFIGAKTRAGLVIWHTFEQYQQQLVTTSNSL